MSGDKHFRGWTGDFQRFFLGLELDNSKRYFEANRSLYESEVKGPMLALLASLEPEFGRGKLFRPNRDIRFSADKSPYKTNLAADVGMEGRGGYVALDARGVTVAAGRYHLSPEELPRYRSAVAEESGEALAEIVAELEKAGYEIGGEELKRVPPPLPQDHPRGRLLRHKRLYYWRRFELEPWIGTPAARDRIVKVWSDGEPLNRWLSRQLG